MYIRDTTWPKPGETREPFPPLPKQWDCNGWEYLNYVRVLMNPCESHNCVTVKIYDNGRWPVTPNPFDDARAPETHRQYEEGLYISFDTVEMERDAFCDRYNWNS